MLRQVWLQQYYLNEEVVCWRDAKMLPPCSIRIQSPYDPDARYSSKRTIQWVGYKVHLTETCDDDAPHLITDVKTTPGTLQDVNLVEDIHADLDDLDCLPAQHIVDTGCSASGLFFNSQINYGIDLIAPIRSEHSCQLAAKTGFDASNFQID